MTRLIVFTALIVALIGLIPWRRESPRHRFIFEQLKWLEDASDRVSTSVDEFPARVELRKVA